MVANIQYVTRSPLALNFLDMMTMKIMIMTMMMKINFDNNNDNSKNNNKNDDDWVANNQYATRSPLALNFLSAMKMIMTMMIKMIMMMIMMMTMTMMMTIKMIGLLTSNQSPLGCNFLRMNFIL